MKGKFYILSTHCTAIQKARALEPVQELACWLWTRTVMSHSVTRLLWMVSRLWSRLLEPHLWSHSHYTGCSLLRLHSALSQAVPVKKKMMMMMMIRFSDTTGMCYPLALIQVGSEAPHQWQLYSTFIFMLCFTEIITLFVVVTKGYYHWCMDSVDEGCSLQPDITEAGSRSTNGTLLMRPTDRLLDKKWTSFTLHSAVAWWNKADIYTSSGVCIPWTTDNGIDGMEENYDYGNCEMYLKF